MEKELQKKKVLVGMSGGVDSSAAACLLQEEGLEVAGATLHLFDNPTIGLTNAHTCCSLEDVEDAAAVCDRLGVKHMVFNGKESFRKHVITPFCQCYEAGDTPNPCIECNRSVKFTLLYRRMRDLGYDYIATGHYVRREYDEASGRYVMRKGLDEKKDQSYMLYMLSQEMLSATLFPLGGYTKAEVREVAASHGFVNASKHDSQDICFVPDGDYAAFLEREKGEPYPGGDFLDSNGKKLGEHKGFVRYTLGQRKGLGISSDRKLYVCAKNAENNTVILDDEKALFSSELYATRVNWLSIPAPEGTLKVKAKVRYHHAEQPAEVEIVGEDRVRVRFEKPQRAITPGQAVVFYDGDLVLGGGTITEAVRE